MTREEIVEKLNGVGIYNIDALMARVYYYRSHLDAFISQYWKIRLADTQQVIARAFGLCEIMDIVQSRGYGKTWQMALCSLAMGTLYPGSSIVIASRTGRQARLVLDKIISIFARMPDIMREIESLPSNKATEGICVLKNGSTIMSTTQSKARGLRAKIIVVDEAPEVPEDKKSAILRPIRNETRMVCIQNHLKDYPSKMVSITSACNKSNPFYHGWLSTLTDMGRGDLSKFACALDYQSAQRVGITDATYFEEERRTLPSSIFASEYGSYFIGEESNSVFPYALTEPCRKLYTVETHAPKGSNSRYIMSLDIATSSEKNSDNAVQSVIRLFEREDGSFRKEQKFMKSYNGKKLSFLAEEVRKTYAHFPGTEVIVFDQRGLGDSLPEFFQTPWIDEETGVEYPPLGLDDGKTYIPGALNILHAVKANASLNEDMANATIQAMQQEAFLLPVSSRSIDGSEIVMLDEDGVELSRKTLTMEEKAIFLETDALQIEMGNIIRKTNPSGSSSFEPAKATQHKDRYSSVSMALGYIRQIERDNMSKKRQGGGERCQGIVSSL